MNAIVSRKEWETLLRRAPIPKSYMNELVMEYLVVEGHRDAAAALAEESGTKREPKSTMPKPSAFSLQCETEQRNPFSLLLAATQSLESIDTRVAIREATMSCDVRSAQSIIEDHHPHVSIHSQADIFVYGGVMSFSHSIFSDIATVRKKVAVAVMGESLLPVHPYSCCLILN
jgi:hypothetical protein